MLGRKTWSGDAIVVRGWQQVIDESGYALGQRISVGGGWIYRFYGALGSGMSYVVVDDPAVWLAPPAKDFPVQIALELPTRVNKEGMTMPNFELPNDEVVTVTIKTTNAAGQVEPVPAGDTFTVTSSNAASLQVAIGQDANGNPAVVMTPLVQASPNLTVTVADSAGLAKAVQLVDIVQDVTPANIILDVADAAHTMQTVPTNPGP